ncbi:MAG TPA: hypothetical protein VMV94_12345 [Phycisphaerae bacterium]|nr:hypothetical protein [Phycisphaerae bacterium]
MSQLVPNRFLFKFEIPLHRCARALKIDGRADDWDDRYLLPALHQLDAEEGFGRVYAAWNEGGLYIACAVEGKSLPLRCDASRFWKSDNLRLMTDMRDTRTIRRATRFCQQFYFMPTGGGSDGDEPVAGGTPVHRAAEDAPAVPPGVITIASLVTSAGYSLTGHIPAKALSGFDPVEHSRIGLFYMVEDNELGQQSLTIGDDLNWWIDPSTWPTAVLTE